MRIEGMIGTPGMPLVGPATPGTGRTETFQHLLLDSIAQVNGLQGEAERIVERVGAGEEINPAVVADAVNKADLAFRTMIQVRNKLTQAFDELRQLSI